MKVCLGRGWRAGSTWKGCGLGGGCGNDPATTRGAEDRVRFGSGAAGSTIRLSAELAACRHSGRNHRVSAGTGDAIGLVSERVQCCSRVFGFEGVVITV